MKNLKENKILDNVVSNLLLDIFPILNKVIHTDIDNTDFADLEWIIEKRFGVSYAFRNNFERS